MTLELGQRVRVKARLVKKDSNGDAVWTRLEYATPIDGIVTGLRTKQRGRWRSDDEGWGRNWYFWRKESVPVVVVTFDLRRDPICANKDDVEVIA